MIRLGLPPSVPTGSSHRSGGPLDLRTLRRALYSPECVEGKFSEVRCSKLGRSGRGLGTWTGAKRTPSRS